jgi:SAM-dependent methyltransferase
MLGVMACLTPYLKDQKIYPLFSETNSNIFPPSVGGARRRGVLHMNSEERKKPWYSEDAGFFGEYYFDIVNINPVNENTPKQCDFIEKILGLNNDAKILDLCCGHGRFTNELALRGYDLTGQDINGYFLNLAEKNAGEMNLNINWIKSDMRDIPFSNEFDAVLNMFTSFGYLGSDDEDEKVISAVHDALKPGGKFILDYINKDFIIRRFLAEDRREISNGYVIITRKYDFLRCSHFETFDIYLNDKFVKRFENHFRFYAASELVSMLERNGFKILDAYGDFDYKPLSLDSKGCIILAQK